MHDYIELSDKDVKNLTLKDKLVHKETNKLCHILIISNKDTFTIRIGEGYNKVKYQVDKKEISKLYGLYVKPLFNKKNQEKDSSDNNGGKTDYYQLSSAPFNINDADDFIEWRKMNFAQGNILKVAWTFNVGRHDGTDAIRDLNKIIHYAEREKQRILRGK